MFISDELSCYHVDPLFFYLFSLFHLLGPPFHCDEEDVNRHFSKYIKICSRISSIFQPVSELYSAPLVGELFLFCYKRLHNVF